MKKTLLFTLLLACCGFFAQAQDCSDLFISEYIEGSNNNKALEIYNPTEEAIDLSDYRIIRWSNGNATYSDLYALDLSGTIESYGTYVMVLDKRDCTQTGQDTCVFEGLMEKADAFYSPVYDNNRTLYHNGNDAISLNKISDDSTIPYGAFVDIFAQIGIGADVDGVRMRAWTDNPVPSNPAYPPYTCFAGDFDCTWWTANHTMIRKPSVKSGVSQNPNGFNPAEQWDTLGINVFTELGSHTCECAGVGFNEDNRIVDARLELFPNPNRGQFQVTSPVVINTIEIYNISGQLVHGTPVFSTEQKVNLENLPTGTYFVKTSYQDGMQSYDKFIVE